MGIIQRQSIKTTIVSFVGVVVGAISLLFIYPLDTDFYGYIQYLYNTAMFLVPFASFGVLTLVVKFFPKFQDKESGNNGFLSLLNLMLLLGLSLFLIGFSLFKEPFYQFLDFLEFRVDMIRENELSIIGLTIILAFISLYQYFAIGYKRIVVPNMIHPFLLKLFLPVLVLLFVYNHVDEQNSIYLFLAFFMIILGLILLYTFQQKQLKFTWNPSFVGKSLRKEMKVYTLFGSLNMIGNVLAFRLDAIMITLLLGLQSTGQYFLIYFIANIIEIPMRSMNQISSSLISELMTNNKLDEVEVIYKKSSLNLLIAGTFIFLLIWFTMEDIFQLSIDPTKFVNGKSIFLFLGIAKLVDMLTSVNSYIIIYSKYFKFNVLFVLILGVSNVFLNYFLIGEFDLVGAAMATCISMVLFNLIKLVFIYYKFKMVPFSNGILKLLLIVGVTFGIAYLLPSFSSYVLNVLLNGTVITLVFGLLVLGFKVSNDINKLFFNVWDIVKKRFSK